MSQKDIRNACNTYQIPLARENHGKERFMDDLGPTTSMLPVDPEDVWGVGGTGLGMGSRMSIIGKHMVPLREEYMRKLDGFTREVSGRIRALQSQSANMSSTQMKQEVNSLARWTVNRRNQVINQVRSRQFWDTRLSLIGRDVYVYKGRRTYEKVYAKQAKKLLARNAKPATKLEVDWEIIHRSSKSNLKVTEAIEKGGKFLKHGGRVIWVFSAGALAYELASTPKRDMPKVIARELGGTAGGMLGSGVATGLCVAFGIATGGWGLLTCGVVGGLGGGMAGSRLLEGLFFSQKPTSSSTHGEFDRFPPHEIQKSFNFFR